MTAGETVPDLILGSLMADAAEGAGLALFVYDENGKYLAMNRYGAAMLGYEREELLGLDVGDFTKDGIDRTRLQTTERREGVRRVRRRDASEITAAFLVVPTRVSGMKFHLALVWELDPSDPRAVDAE